MPKFKNVLRTTDTVEKLLVDIDECLRTALDTRLLNGKPWKWREIEHGEIKRHKRSENTLSLHKFVRFRGSHNLMGDSIDVQAIFMLVGVVKIIDSGFGEGVEQSTPPKMKCGFLSIVRHRKNCRLTADLSALCGDHGFQVRNLKETKLPS